MKIKRFTFNYFSENTYVLYDETLECAVVDPGCCNREEEQQLQQFIEEQKLKPVLLLNTHCHIDHILGNHFVASGYKLGLNIHPTEHPVLQSGVIVADRYGIPYHPSPEPSAFLKEGVAVTFGNTSLDVLFTPGHSPGSVCFVNHSGQSVIAGDVLFNGSIGRTDLPGGNFETLAHSIRTQLYTLNDVYTVYPGHGEPTTIGQEKQSNPFVKAGLPF